MWLHILISYQMKQPTTFIIAYIMNTFKCRNHCLDASSAFNTPIHSTIGHFSNHLFVKIQMLSLC